MECKDEDINKCLQNMGILDSHVEVGCLGKPALVGFFQFLSFIFFLFGAVGNAVFAIVTAKSQQALETKDLFLVGLACLDFLASIFLPLLYFLEISGHLVHTSDGGCQFMILMHEVSIVLTVFILIFAVHSFYRKFIYERSEEYGKIRFCGLFLLGILLVVIPAIPIVMDTRAKKGVCHVEMTTFTSVVLYDVIIFIIQVILPILVFTIMFSQMAVQLLHNRIRPNIDITENASNRRMILLLLIITCSFYALFLPYMFAHLWFLLDGGRVIEDRFSCYVYDIFHLMICGKCILNPIFYLLYYEGFREKLSRIICSCRIGRRHTFEHVRSYFEHRNEEILIEETDAPSEQGHMLSEIGSWKPSKKSSPVPTVDPDLALNETDHDYEEENDTGDDNMAILKTWKNLRSTSTF